MDRDAPLLQEGFRRVALIAGSRVMSSRDHCFAHRVGYTRFNAAPLIKLKKAPRQVAQRIMGELEVRLLIRAARPGRDRLMLEVAYFEEALERGKIKQFAKVHENSDPHPMGKERFDALMDAMVKGKPLAPMKPAPKAKR